MVRSSGVPEEGFDRIWSEAARYRRASRELAPLVRAAHEASLSGDARATRDALEHLLAFLSSGEGRTDANCCVTDAFFSAVPSDRWNALPEPLRAILDDLGGVLHDTIYAPHIARTFESLPEQLLERVRRVNLEEE